MGGLLVVLAGAVAAVVHRTSPEDTTLRVCGDSHGKYTQTPGEAELAPASAEYTHTHYSPRISQSRWPCSPLFPCTLWQQADSLEPVKRTPQLTTYGSK